MKRYHQELARTKRMHRMHLRIVHGWPKQPVPCPCDLQAGRFRKNRALGCGRPKCLVCHYEKVMNIPSVKDLVREQRYKYSLEDYFELCLMGNFNHAGNSIADRSTST